MIQLGFGECFGEPEIIDPLPFQKITSIAPADRVIYVQRGNDWMYTVELPFVAARTRIGFRTFAEAHADAHRFERFGPLTREIIASPAGDLV